jgi:putative DNA primase/helicase
VYSEGETADEIELNITSVKEITGQDMIHARGLFKDPINFHTMCKLSFLANYVPPLDGQDAVKIRTRFLFFDSQFVVNPKGPNQFKADDDFVEKLKTEYLSEVFSWFAQGAYEYYQTKTIEMSPKAKERTNDLINSEDSIESFISAKCVITNNEKDYIRKLLLFDAYKAYCTSNSQRCKPRSTLFNRLADKNVELKLKGKDGYDVYRGIQIKLDVRIPTVDTTNQIHLAISKAQS